VRAGSEASPALAIFDQDARFASSLCALLMAEGYRSVAFPDFTESALALAFEQENVQAIVLDLSAAELGRLHAIDRIRAHSDVPILVVSADGIEQDKVDALDAGADDYLTKPLAAREFLARVRLALRHGRARGGVSGKPIEVGELCIELERRAVTLRGQRLALTPTDYKLLALLARHLGRVVPHERLLHEAWGPNARDPHYLRVYMARLRRKLDPDRRGAQFILTEPGIGYRLAARPDLAPRR
jgi:two-component system KDP operon response regulator KdpE